ncbi:hypothetical protein predicted by Glimmer/Critica [Acetobacter ghanensis]|uniref:Uncharacterized protein n=1 Tax=Acetobacter ghanensis TaxID=431306 RepID=A0A0U5F5G0_9PROT|nr:hypothetical protein predicted by Glimmer/Critica [Acetobacter ghanensis]
MNTRKKPSAVHSSVMTFHDTGSMLAAWGCRSTVLFA